MSINFTAFQLDYNHYRSSYITKIAMIKVRNGESVNKKEIELFPQALIKQPLAENSTIQAFNKRSWDDALAYIKKDILVSFHGVPNKELGTFFRDYEIPEPNVTC
ncbi:MAG: hypothetical protein FWC50_07830, partial [Planctomycetaceae bacterium]|nr:hypothetical protein [Planctomycetaceae bacterium]